MQKLNDTIHKALFLHLHRLSVLRSPVTPPRVLHWFQTSRYDLHHYRTLIIVIMAQPAPAIVDPAVLEAANIAFAQAQQRIEQLEQQVAAARKVKLPTFYSGSGKKDEPTLNNWASAMEVYFRAAKVTRVQEQLELAGACLTGTAVDWFNHTFWPSFTPLTTWSNFVVALRQRFEPVDSETTARARLNTLRQGKYSVTGYTNMFVDLIGRVGAMNDKDQYEHYVNGLRKEIADELRLHMVGRQQQLAIAMALAFEIESALSRNANQPKGTWQSSVNPWRRGGGNNRFNAKPPQPSSFTVNYDGPVPMELGHIGATLTDDEDDEKHDVDKVDETDDRKSYSLAAMQQHASPSYARSPLPKLSDIERAKLRASGSCFRCRQPGHVSRDCPLQYNHNNRPKA